MSRTEATLDCSPLDAFPSLLLRGFWAVFTLKRTRAQTHPMFPPCRRCHDRCPRIFVPAQQNQIIWVKANGHKLKVIESSGYFQNRQAVMDATSDDEAKSVLYLSLGTAWKVRKGEVDTYSYLSCISILHFYIIYIDLFIYRYIYIYLDV